MQISWVYRIEVCPYWRIPSSSYSACFYNSEILEEISSIGEGKYIDGNKTQETIDVIEDILLKAEKSEFETKQFSDYKDQFQWFIGFALLFLLIDVLLLEKKTKWIQKLNLFNEKK
mgnify:CR=1 FL=1